MYIGKSTILDNDNNYDFVFHAYPSGIGSLFFTFSICKVDVAFEY